MKPGPNLQQQVDVCVGKLGTLVGQLRYVKLGQRENSSFAYDAGWLAGARRFEVSPDLPLVLAHQTRRAPSKSDSVFHFALADSAPDAWGSRVIARAHARERKRNPQLGGLTEMDYLAAVDDFSRVGALRLRDAGGTFLRTAAESQRGAPPLVELKHIYAASQAVEKNQETAADLRYLQGKGTSLGGMRPKCTVLVIANVDDHLQNHGFLYQGNGQWRLAPAFDINPFPDKDRESKTWLTQDSGPIDSLEMLLGNAAYFGLSGDAARGVLAEVLQAVSHWRTEALGPEVGLRKRELEDFAPAFEHEAAEAAREVLGLSA